MDVVEAGVDATSQNRRASESAEVAVDAAINEEKQQKDKQQERALSATRETVLSDKEALVGSVSQFFNNDDMSDITIVIGESSFPAHKFVLSKSSDVFKAMLFGKPWQDGSNQLTLNETAEDAAVFDKFLKFLYCGSVCISNLSSVGLLCLADKYNVAALKLLCEQYMIREAQNNLDNALTWYFWARTLRSEKLMAQCMETISWSANKVLSSSDWLTMDLDFVKHILQQDSLVIYDEYFVFQSVSKWLFHPSRSVNIIELSQEVLPLVRFAQMLVQDLFKVETSEIAKEVGCQKLIVKLLGEAHRFHNLCPIASELAVEQEFRACHYQPRNYSKCTVDMVKLRTALRFGISVDVKMYIGPVPSCKKEGEFKIRYLKNGESWNVTIHTVDTALINSTAKFLCAAIIYNSEDDIIQVNQAEQPFTCSRGETVNIVVLLKEPDEATAMAVLIKPIP